MIIAPVKIIAAKTTTTEISMAKLKKKEIFIKKFSTKNQDHLLLRQFIEFRNFRGDTASFEISIATLRLIERITIIGTLIMLGLTVSIIVDKTSATFGF